jgi:hypothetical protein
MSCPIVIRVVEGDGTRPVVVRVSTSQGGNGSCPAVVRVASGQGPPGIGLPAGTADAGKFVRKLGATPYLYELVTPDAVGLPQGLGPTNSPTFAGLTLSGIAASRLVFTGAGGALAGLSLGSGLSIVDGALTATTSGYPSLTVPTGFSVTGSGTASLAIGFAAGYSLPANTRQAGWDSALTLATAAAPAASLAAVATSGAYADLSGRPTLGTAAATDATAYATAAQGLLAGTAVQPATLATTLATALADKVVTTDLRLTDAREWSAATVEQAEAEAGIATTRRAWTAQRVRQAVAAWWAATASAAGQAMATAADAAAQRLLLGLSSTDSPTFAGLTVSGTATLEHIHGSIAGEVYQHIRADGVPLAALTPYHVVDSQGDTDLALVIAARADSAASMPAAGLVETALSSNGTGHGVVAGVMTGCNTAGLVSGDPVYVALAGGLTLTRPTTGLVQVVAVVGRVHASTGTLVLAVGPALPAWIYVNTTDAGNISSGTLGAARLPASGVAANTYGSGSQVPVLTVDATGRVTSASLASVHDPVTLGASVSGVLDLTGQVLGADDPGADRILFWDDSSGNLTHLSTDSALLIDGTVLRALSTLVIPLTGEAANLTNATLLTVPYWPEARVLTALPIFMVNTAPTGSVAQFDIRIGGTSIFATLPTIDATEISTATAATPAVFSAAFIAGGQTIAAGSSVSFHCTQIGATVAGAGLKVALPSRRAS